MGQGLIISKKEAHKTTNFFVWRKKCWAAADDNFFEGKNVATIRKADRIGCSIGRKSWDQW